jgi:RNA polymerase sigma factor (sigma-70 family)
MESLTEKVLQYQKTRQGLKEIVEEIGPRVYRYPRRTMGWDEDACGDFYVFVHPRLIRLLDRFQDQGRPFESYLWTVLGWQMRNFARERRRGVRAWNVTLRMEPPGPALPVEPPSFAERSLAEAVRSSAALAHCIRSSADRRNFLFLCLKCSRSLDEEGAAALAAISAVTPARLLGLAAELRLMRAAREVRLQAFRCRRNKAYVKARLLETELQSETDPERLRELRAALCRTRARMRSAMRRMARVGLSPTNQEIARLLGVPKGTVDSGLYWLKKKLASVYDPDLRSA